MFSKAKVTEIYCMADDFCEEFAKVQEKYMVKDKNHKHFSPLCMIGVLFRFLTMQIADFRISLRRHSEAPSGRLLTFGPKVTNIPPLCY